MRKLIHLGKKIYDVSDVKEYRRLAVFVIRSLWRKSEMEELVRFFEATPMRRKIALKFPCVFEQATRHFFYHQSTFPERSQLIKEHFELLETRLSPQFLQQVYLDGGIVLWKDELPEEAVCLKLMFKQGYKKEGLLTIELFVGKKRFYQATFWVGYHDSGDIALCIGALQGSKGGGAMIQHLTRHFHGFRPKNMILFSLRNVAAVLGAKRIIAISNQGYYANNHFRLDRKLKTSMDEFWGETDGKLSQDPRFFELSVEEPRKSDGEIPPRKRSLYRKRFAFLDSVQAEMFRNLLTRSNP